MGETALTAVLYYLLAYTVSNVLAFGALILAGWCVALASGPDAYLAYMTILGSPLGKLVFFGLTISVFYHLANGVRHLMWDAGAGLDIKSANFTAVSAIAFAIAATVAVWGIAAMTGALS